MASTGQINYITSLATTVFAGQPDMLVKYVFDAAALNNAQVSARLDFLKGLAKRTAAKATPPAVIAAKGWYLADGEKVKYAISSKGFPYLYTEDGGYIAGASAKGRALLAVIHADPKACAIAYGKTTGKCSICHATLTDPNSIAAGIGPICAGKF